MSEYRGGFFTHFAKSTAHYAGTPWVFLLACSVVIIWVITGPLFGYSDTWQLVINTGTTIVTFLMVFLIQNTQNRDTRAMQIKLDELIRTNKGAHTALLDLEELSDEEITAINRRYESIAKKSRKMTKEGKSDTSTPHVEITPKKSKSAPA